LTFIDHFATYVEAIPLKDMCAESFTQAHATYVIVRHGAGSILMTDQERPFTSAFFKETCKILEVKQMHSSAYHPAGNGTIEKMRKTKNHVLCHYVNASGKTWDDLITFHLMAHRATSHGTRGFSPYYLLRGREMILPNSQDLGAKLTPDVREKRICA
jgi:transposase InsO family protein